MIQGIYGLVPIVDYPNLIQPRKSLVILVLSMVCKISNLIMEHIINQKKESSSLMNPGL